MYYFDLLVSIYRISSCSNSKEAGETTHCYFYKSQSLQALMGYRNRTLLDELDELDTAISLFTYISLCP